jgi:argininosuccinate synthase
MAAGVSRPHAIVLAYSGGLDTSVAVPWLREHYGGDGTRIICMCADLGQGDDMDQVRRNAVAAGADACHVVDAREEFVREFAFPVLQAAAVYEGRYLLGTSFARPCIARHLVRVAHAEGADAVAHGATGKGNDQVRFELAVKALDPDLRVIAPWREWHIRSREDAMAYAAAHGVHIPVTPQKPYSRDENLWHTSHEGGILEDPAQAPPDDLLLRTARPEDASVEAATVSVGFEGGLPVALEGRPTGPVDLLTELNRLGGRHGVGVVSLVENRLVGMKSRGVYETPGGTILHEAHAALEELVLDRQTLHFKQQVALRYADLVYEGFWFTPLKEALDAFVQSTQRHVTGTVRVRLYRGRAEAVGAESPYSLYDPGLATFGNDGAYRHEDARGFITLLGLPLAVQARLRRRAGGGE